MRRQRGYFQDEAAIERDWLDYNARFRAQSNFMSHAASPFGDPDDNAKPSSRFTIARGKQNPVLHHLWREARSHSRGFADARHPFRHQGSADLNLYKLFLEGAHGLLREGGRLGFVVPSGLYSDHGTGALRTLFLEHCQWEWLFGIENRAKVFPIDSRFKFNPVVIQKGGTTDAIRTAFMRRDLEDWERAEEVTTHYGRAQVVRFSPKSRAILEIQSQRDLEILEKIYANSVLLGDDGPDGWGIKYTTEFHMTNDSHLFPPRPQWEAKGYRPDEYSRWLKGDWRPIGELWAEMGIDPNKPVPAEVELEDWLFDTSAGPERREAEKQFVHGHLLKPGDVARTNWRVRCAQPPYDSLPIPRADLPEGVVLSREADAWIRADRIGDVALPFYEGRMIGQFDFSQKGWVSGKGRGALWRDIPNQVKQVEPQYLMSLDDYQETVDTQGQRKVAIMDITSSANTRTMIAALLSSVPCGNSLGVLECSEDLSHLLAATLNSFVFDYALRARFSGLHASWFVLEDAPLPPQRSIRKNAVLTNRLRKLVAGLASDVLNSYPVPLTSQESTTSIAVTHHERLRLRIHIDALMALAFEVEPQDLRIMLTSNNSGHDTADTKGFWRVDRGQPSELRQTYLTMLAFSDLHRRVSNAGGNPSEGTRDFLTQNMGEGWIVPELVDVAADSKSEAGGMKAVATRLGARFMDWQLAESQHTHVGNLVDHS